MAHLYFKFFNSHFFKSFYLFIPCHSPPKTPLTHPQRRRTNNPIPLCQTWITFMRLVCFLVGDMSKDTINFGMEEPNDTDILTEVADTVMNIDIGVLREDDGDNESNTSLVIEVTDCGMECNEILLEDNRDFQLSDFKELQIEVIDCSAVKREEISTAGYILSSGAYLLPHPSKASTGGDDAYFIVGQNWLGVADGVSQGREKGINPGIYSRELMENCRKIVSECNSIPLTNPEEVIRESNLEAKSPGSSTILVAYFDGQVLHVANIGDSGFIVIRNGVVYKKSTPTSFEFNCPFQIESGDDPSELVEMYEIDLDEGDVIVTSTDGLFDNLYNPEIVSIVSKLMQSNFKLEEIAEALARRAHEIGNSTTGMTPIVDAIAALKTKDEEVYTGGKLDDVVVIVSLVQKISSPHMD